VSLLRQSVAGLSPLRSGFNPRSVHVRFVLEEVTLEKVILLGIAFFSLSVSFHQCSIFFIYTLLVTQKKNGRDWKLSKQAINFWKGVTVYGKVLSLSFVKERGKPGK
jgi:hypothetical protein